MKILNDEDLKNGGFVPNGRAHPVAIALMTLEIGQSLHVTAADWTWKKRSPGILARRVEKQTGRSFQLLKQSGVRAWAIRRLG